MPQREHEQPKPPHSQSRRSRNSPKKTMTTTAAAPPTAPAVDEQIAALTRPQTGTSSGTAA